MFERISIQSITLTKSVLGIDVNDHRVRVVELRRSGNPFKPDSYRFKAPHSFAIEFVPNSTNEQKAECLADAIRQRGIKTRFCCSSVRSIGTKTLTARVPSSVENVEEWLAENREKLLRFPISLKEFSFGFEVLRADESHTLIEVTFVRNADIDIVRTILKQAGLQLLSLGAGTRDAVNTFMHLRDSSDAGSFMFVERDTATHTALDESGQRETRQIRLSQHDDLSDALTKGGISLDPRLSVTGDEAEMLPQSHVIFRPFGLPTEFTLAAGLALKGFLPSISPVDFLSDDEHRIASQSLDRSLFHQIALTLGVMLLVLLGGQILVSNIIQWRIDTIEEELLSSSATYSEIESLEQQVNTLEGKLSPGAQYRGTDFSRSMHQVALAIPPKVVLSHLAMEKVESNRTRITVAGTSSDNSSIATLLKQLETEARCSDVTLVRSGVQEKDALRLPNAGAGCITFEINANVSRPNM